MSPVATKAKKPQAKRRSPTVATPPVKAALNSGAVGTSPAEPVLTGIYSPAPPGFDAQCEEVLRVLESLELPETDGVPLESAWHRECINLLIESVKAHLEGRTDFSVGGNLCFYFDVNQARNKDFLGPDFFYVRGESPTSNRNYWATWEQGGRYPNVIVELLSPTTSVRDHTEKKAIYEQVFRTAEYFLYDPFTHVLEGFRLVHQKYEPIVPDANGRLWCEELNLFLGTWQGVYQSENDLWLRFFEPNGCLVPVISEREAARAEREAERAELEAARAERAERAAANAQAEVARLRALLASSIK